AGLWGHAMAYDAGRGQVVLFGGNATGTSVSATWAWNGTSWSSLPANPGAGGTAGMAYDQGRHELVAVGVLTGASTLGTPSTAWQRPVASGLRPSPTSLVYDAAHGNTVAFSGGSTFLLTLADLEVGGSCIADGDCASGHCVDHVCCATSCTGAC